MVTALTAASPACDLCTMKLQHRSGPYVIRIAFAPERHKPYELVIEGTVKNTTTKTVVPSSSAFGTLNLIGPHEKARLPVWSLAPNHPLPPGAAIRFTARSELDSSGTYHLNVSYGTVDSNALTMTRLSASSFLLLTESSVCDLYRSVRCGPSGASGRKHQNVAREPSPLNAVKIVSRRRGPEECESDVA